MFNSSWIVDPNVYICIRFNDRDNIVFTKVDKTYKHIIPVQYRYNCPVMSILAT